MIDSLCKTCEKRYACIMYEPIATVAGCSYFVRQKKVVKTNADRIRAMTDEELAEWLEKHCFQYGWLDWLKREANDD